MMRLSLRRVGMATVVCGLALGVGGQPGVGPEERRHQQQRRVAVAVAVAGAGVAAGAPR